MAGPVQQPPADEVAKFMAATQAAMNDILRARKDAGVAPSDPMEPLIVALARSLGTLGRLPSVLAERLEAAEDQAVGHLGQTLQIALAELVQQSGAAMAARSKLRWLCWTGVLLAAVFGGGWYIAADRAFDAGVASEHWRAEAAITQAQAAVTAANSPEGKVRGWWVAGLTDQQYQAARWAAGAPVKPFMALTGEQLQNLGTIASQADGWTALRKESKAPWPCIVYEKSNRWSWNGGPTANVCITGYGNY